MRAWVAAAAAAAPSLLAYNLSPSPTFLNQALALGFWAAFVLVAASRWPGRAGLPLTLALALVAAGIVWSWGPGALPSSLALSALGLVFAAAVLAVAGAGARADSEAPALFNAFAGAWVIAGALNLLVALIQVFAPGLADGHWIASSNLPGRAVGNLRQPNHLSSLLMWSAIGAVALLEAQALSRRLAAALLGLFVFGVVLTASRTGVLGVLLLALWGMLDRRLAKSTRLMLLLAPVVYGIAWFGMAQWAALSRSTFGGAERLAEVGDTSSRVAIWRETLALLRDSPWTGVGFGDFNFAWTLTPFPGRPTAFFDHTHNLPLQVLVELGIPLGGAVLALLLVALARSVRGAWRLPATDPTSVGARASVMMVLMIGVHSLLEYPLWYAYFLLPAAWAWGFASGQPATAAAARPAAPPPAAPSRALQAAAAAVVLGAALSIVDYTRVVAIFSSADGAPPLEQRIERGRRSVLFSHHADYAAVTSGVVTRHAAASFAETTHYLLDSRLMIAWAEWLDARGETDLARHLAGRLREFRSPDAIEFFATCPTGAAAATAAPGPTEQPFQCELPQRIPHWRDYLSVGRTPAAR